jgi:hypothetical protein
VHGGRYFNSVKFELSVANGEQWLMPNRNEICTFDSKSVYTARLFLRRSTYRKLITHIAGDTSRAIEP